MVTNFLAGPEERSVVMTQLHQLPSSTSIDSSVNMEFLFAFVLMEALSSHRTIFNIFCVNGCQSHLYITHKVMGMQKHLIMKVKLSGNLKEDFHRGLL